jgi:hypothetical protein
MGRRTLIYSGALTLLMGLSISTYTGEETATSSEGVVVVDISRDSVSEVHYQSPDRDVLLSLLSDEAGEYLWAQVTVREEVEVESTEEDSDGNVEEVGEESTEEDNDGNVEEAGDNQAPTATTTEVQTTVTSFKAGTTLLTLIDSIAPLNAKRSIETTDSLDAFGLESGFATLTVNAGENTEAVNLGGAAYRTQDRYISDAAGSIYIIDSSPLSPLTRSPRSLQDRSLIGVELNEIVAIAIASVNRDSLEVRQINPDHAEAAFWAREGENAASPPIQDWIGKLLRMNAGNYVQDGEEPTTTSEEVSVRVLSLAGDTVTMSIISGQNADGEDAFYATSTHTRGTVMLEPSRAENLIADFASVVMSPLGNETP